MTDELNLATRGRHGDKLRDLGLLDAEGNWEPFEPVPLEVVSERDPVAVRWVIAGLVVFWTGLIMAVVEWVKP